MVSLEKIRGRSAARCGKDSRRWEEALTSQASRAGARDPKKDERYKGSGEERENRTPPRRATGSLSGPEYRGPGALCFWAGRWGTNVSGTHCREGEAGHHVFLEGPLGETPGSPTVSMQLQSMAQQATHSPAMGCNNVCHLRDGAFLREASHQTHKRSAPGMDQVTAKQYAEHVDENLRELH